MRASTTFVFLLSACVMGSVLAESAYEIGWTRETPGIHGSYDMATDAWGNLFVAGDTYGSLGGSNAGETDAVLAKYDRAGNLQWIRQWGTSYEDMAVNVIMDTSGNAVVVTSTRDQLFSPDISVARYDPAGNLISTCQFGSIDFPYASAMTADAQGNLFVAAHVSQSSSVTKYDNTGSLAWTQPLSRILSFGEIALDAEGNLFVTGSRTTQLPPDPFKTDYWDVFVSKFGPDGAPAWSQYFGTEYNDTGQSLITDAAGNVFTAGRVSEPLEPQYSSVRSDAFLAKHDPYGNQLWMDRFGTNGADGFRNIAIDAESSIFVLGYTIGSVTESDGTFVAKYDSQGNVLWTQPIVTYADVANTISVGKAGDLFVIVPDGQDGIFITKFDMLGGDLNGDGWMNALDIHPFVQLLVTGAYQMDGDLNEDGTVDARDIARFVGCITMGACGGTGGEGSPVPDPATLSLLALSAISLSRRRASPQN